MALFENVYLGSLPVDRAYLGSALVYEALPTLLTFTTTGSTFSPFVELHSGESTTVEWLDESQTLLATGLTPTIDFGSAATRVVTMAVQDPEAVRIVNLGFNDQDDNGRDSLPASYNKPAEQVIAVDGLQYLPNLYAFMAANGPLAGHLDLSNCAHLAYLECFGASLTSIDLTGCLSLIRLCFEANNLTELDLNPVRPTLRDLRAANQQSGELTFTTLDGPMWALWHFCCRSQQVYNLIPFEHLPVVEQYWMWNAGLSGTIRVQSSALLDSVLLNSPGSARPELENTITTLDLSDNEWANNSTTRLYVYEMESLTSIDMSGTVRGPATTRAYGCSLNQAQQDALLVAADGWGTTTRTLNIQNNPQQPSVTTGQPAITSLTGKGWTLTHDTPEDIVESYWVDTFERADGAPGSPWVVPALGGGSPVAAISSGRLTVTGGSSYQRCWALPSGIPTTDYEVEIEFDGTPSTMAYFGIGVRMGADGAGGKVMFPDAGNPPRGAGAASASGAVMTAVDPLPSSWSSSGTHTLAVRASGATLVAVCDGVTAFTNSASTQQNGANTGVGIVGQLHNFTINKITVRPL